MQTFLPYASYVKSARVLDRQRLGKQRIESKQILQTLLGESNGWKNHPAVRMWKGYEIALIDYSMEICKEWICRGYKDNQLLWFIQKFLALNNGKYIQPIWLNDEFCASHRSNLLRKMPEHYSKFGWSEPNNLPYAWPV